jgi:hypothetical protein
MKKSLKVLTLALVAAAFMVGNVGATDWQCFDGAYPPAAWTVAPGNSYIPGAQFWTMPSEVLGGNYVVDFGTGAAVSTLASPLGNLAAVYFVYRTSIVLNANDRLTIQLTGGAQFNPARGGVYYLSFDENHQDIDADGVDDTYDLNGGGVADTVNVGSTDAPLGAPGDTVVIRINTGVPANALLILTDSLSGVGPAAYNGDSNPIITFPPTAAGTQSIATTDARDVGNNPLAGAVAAVPQGFADFAPWYNVMLMNQATSTIDANPPSLRTNFVNEVSIGPIPPSALFGDTDLMQSIALLGFTLGGTPTNPIEDGFGIFGTETLTLTFPDTNNFSGIQGIAWDADSSVVFDANEAFAPVNGSADSVLVVGPGAGPPAFPPVPVPAGLDLGITVDGTTILENREWTLEATLNIGPAPFPGVVFASPTYGPFTTHLWDTNAYQAICPYYNVFNPDFGTQFILSNNSTQAGEVFFDILATDSATTDPSLFANIQVAGKESLNPGQTELYNRDELVTALGLPGDVVRSALRITVTTESDGVHGMAIQQDGVTGKRSEPLYTDRGGRWNGRINLGPNTIDGVFDPAHGWSE